MKLRAFAFRWRAVLLLPLAVIVIVVGTPTWSSLWLGLGVALLGEALRIWAAGYVGDKSRDTVVQARELVTAGPYRFVRNPLYLANTLMAIGFGIVASGGEWNWRSLWTLLLIVGGYALVYGAIIPYEEEFLRRQYGPAYEAYSLVVPRLFPTIRPYGEIRGIYSWRVIVEAEVHTILLLGVMTVIMAIKIG